MAQGYDKYELDNQTGQSFRFALNDILEAAVTQNSGPNSPNTTNTSYPYQVWVDTDALGGSGTVVKIRDAATASTWYSLYKTDANGQPTGAVATGSYSISTNDTAGTGGTTAITVDTSQRVGIGTSPSTLLHLKTAGYTGDEDLVQFSRNIYEVGKIRRSSGEFKISGEGNLYLEADYNNNLGGADSNILLTIDGGEAVRINSSGILSVNETTPNANRLMTIRSDGTRSAGVALRNTAATDVCQLTIENASTSEDVGLYAKGDAKFYTNSLERLRIDSTGRVAVYGAYSGNYKLFVQNSAGSTTDITYYSELLSGSNNANASHFYAITQGVAVWRLTGNGTSTFTSDERKKKNIETTRDGYLEDLRDLRVVKYNWISQDDDAPKELGLIAQEVEQVFPGLVMEDVQMEGDDYKVKTLKGSVLPFMLLKALQEAAEKIETLEAKVAALESA